MERDQRAEGTPPALIAKLAAALDVALDSEVVKQRFEELAVPVPPKDARGPAPLGHLVERETEIRGAVFKDIAKQ